MIEYHVSEDEARAVSEGYYEDIFSILGLHEVAAGSWEVRAFLPKAEKVEIIDPETQACLAVADNIAGSDVFCGRVERTQGFAYLLAVTWGGERQIIDDPYRYGSSINEQDLYLYGEGTHERAYQFLGAHIVKAGEVEGVRFAVWAPNAKRVSVVGDFNFWDGRRHVMRKHIPGGIWEIFIPGLKPGALYKYELLNRDGHLLPHKADPFGFAAQHPPEQASVVVEQDNYTWQDAGWQDQAWKRTKRDQPIAIYEVHAGSWKRVPEEGNRYLTYRELAHDLIPYVKDMGFTHIQLMPVSEFPFDGSWGYQPVGLYAPTSRFGKPEDFKYFVDQCHQAGIAVLIDWVPGHFPTDEFGLGRFDGTPLYEHADARQGFHPDWNTYIYNYGRREVASFLLANALFWLDKFHIDGLRVDAVASMLYLDYSRNDGEWLANKYGGRENLEAIDFLRLVNQRVYRNYPNAMMVAEESTAWPGVSQPVDYGGLGFGFKWNMGWMNDSLQFMSKDPIHRQYHHHDMTFSLYYAFSENFILPLSHDEVVHGKGSILARMPGDCWQQFANLRAYYAFMYCHPGKKLLFMGNEIAQGYEWDHNNSLSWHQLDMAEHRGVQQLIKNLNHLYTEKSALYELDAEGRGFEWIEADDRHNSIFAFVRKDSQGKMMLVVSNFTPVVREGYRVGVNAPGFYEEILNTDSDVFAGTNVGNKGGVPSEAQPWQHREHSVVITLPALATVIFEYKAP